ncbi:MAG: TolC family protein [Planctomycetota bacterium]|jgi:outer membrane protein TolC
MQNSRFNRHIIVRVLICFLVFAWVGEGKAGSSQAWQTEYGEVARVVADGAGKETGSAAGQAKLSDAKRAAVEPLKLKLSDYVQLVTKRNEQILVQMAEWGIKQEEIKSAQAIFEPEYVSTYQHDDNRQRNSVEELISRKLESIHEERNNNYSLGVEGLIPTGGRLNLGYTKKEMTNSLTKDLISTGKEYRLFAGGSFTQPLFKNAGIKTTTAHIRVAESDATIAFHDYRREMMRIVAEAVVAYWDLYMAQEKVKMRRDSVGVAKQILKDNRERVRTGKMAKTEVLQAESGVAVRKFLETEARQKVIITMNSVRTMFSSSAADDDILVAADRLELVEHAADFNDALRNAFTFRPEYLATRRKIERENIKLEYAENQSWPQLDLKASYGLNGLDSTASGAWRDLESADFDSWSIGLELRIPLRGGLEGKSQLAKVKLQKKQDLLELKAIEVSLANSVDTAVQNVANAAELVHYTSNVVKLEKRLIAGSCWKKRRIIGKLKKRNWTVW